MHPRLLEFPTGLEGFPSLQLPSYFTLLTIGFILATFLARRWGKRHGLDPRRMVDLGIWMVIWGIVGSRLLHVIADGHFWDYVHVCTDPSLVDWKVDVHECAALKGVWDEARGLCHPVETNCFAWADITSGGFAYYGGFIAASLFGWWFIRKHHLPAGKIIDMSGWAITLGLVWGRMGCFLASCCFGARTDSAIGVVFPSGSSPSRHHWEEGLLPSYRLESLPVHPTQLYEAAASLVIAALVYFVVRPHKRFDGQVFVVAMVLYAVARFMLEFIRRDERGGLLGLSTSQLVALGVVAVCAYLWVHFSRRAKKLLAESA
jgi:phosphatidylglycerol:prolipoprotein diacylglycerol transferase